MDGTGHLVLVICSEIAKKKEEIETKRTDIFEFSNKDQITIFSNICLTFMSKHF